MATNAVKVHFAGTIQVQVCETREAITDHLPSQGITTDSAMPADAFRVLLGFAPMLHVATRVE